MADLKKAAYGGKTYTIPTYDDTALAGRVSANETAIADRYTKEQTDEKIAEGIATVDSEHFHPVTVLPDVADAKENHEYILIEYEQDGVTIKSKTFYLFYDGAYHEDRAAGVSLEGYATEQYVDDVTGDLADLTTTAKADLVSAVNEVKSTMEGEHVELTQAQYDALTPAERNNGTVYFITDAEVATVVDQTYDATSPHAQSGTAVAEALAQIKVARLQFAAKQVAAGSQVNFPVSELTLPSDLKRLIVVISISPGPETWGTTVPAVIVTSGNRENVIVRAYVTGNYSPLVDILYL